jgi:hypothetical protein
MHSEAAKDQSVRIGVLNVACNHDTGRLRPKPVIEFAGAPHRVVAFDELKR